MMLLGHNQPPWPASWPWATSQNHGILQSDLTNLRLQQKPLRMQTRSLRQFRRLLGAIWEIVILEIHSCKVRTAIKSMPTTNLGAFIRQTRKGKGISGRELSRRINISAPGLSEIERGIRNPSDAVLERIARSLGVEFEQLHALDAWSALKEFRDMIESDRDLSLSFVGVVRAINTGKVSRKALADKLLQICQRSGR